MSTKFKGMYNMEQKKIDRINELAKKMKTVGLTEEEGLIINPTADQRGRSVLELTVAVYHNLFTLSIAFAKIFCFFYFVFLCETDKIQKMVQKSPKNLNYPYFRCPLLYKIYLLYNHHKRAFRKL